MTVHTEGPYDILLPGPFSLYKNRLLKPRNQTKQQQKQMNNEISLGIVSYTFSFTLLVPAHTVGPYTMLVTLETVHEIPMWVNFSPALVSYCVV